MRIAFAGWAAPSLADFTGGGVSRGVFLFLPLIAIAAIFLLGTLFSV